MIASKRLPSLAAAEAYLREAEARNPGEWVPHCRNVSFAARVIAERHPDLDPDHAAVLGLLHDIGRREGVVGMRHTYLGYRFLNAEGWPDAARICLTHSFPYQDIRSTSGPWDCPEEETAEIETFLRSIRYDRYDELIQLCDSISVADGFWLMEKRLVDVIRRYRIVNDHIILKWDACFEVKSRFEAEIGCPIYDLLPGVVETTFR